MLSRREALAGLSTTAALLLVSPLTHASLARAVSLRELTRASGRVVRGLPAESHCEWATVGGSRRIVTYTRVLVEGDLATPNSESEVMVMTLGGRIGKLGQLVHGEAALREGQDSVVFLTRPEGGLYRVTAFAQGHYPLRPDADDRLRLQRSPQLAELVRADDAAVERLHLRPLEDARRLIERELR